MINWNDIKHFKPTEFSENPDDFADERYIYVLEDFRNYLDERIFPSPVAGALARFEDEDKMSRHYAVGKKSIAGDNFIEGSPFFVFAQALAFRRWNGIGIYLDTKFRDQRWVMFHFDLRRTGFGPYPLIWMRTSRDDYIYPQLNDKDREKFARCLNLEIMREAKELG